MEKKLIKSQLNELNVPKLRFKGFNNEWILKKFKNILIIFDGPHKTPQYFSAGFPFYSVEYVTQNKFNYIDEKQFKQFNKAYSPSVNDILFTRIGVIGITKIIKEQDNLCFSIYVSISAIRILDQAKFSSWFLNYSIQTNKFKKHLLSNSLTTAVPMKINIVDMYKLELNFPLPKEQRKIAEFFSLLDKQIELWERKLQLNELIFRYYTNLFLSRESKFNKYKIKDIFHITRGKVLSTDKISNTRIDNYYPVYSSQTTKNGLLGYYQKYLFQDCITWTTDGANAGTVSYRNEKFYCTNVCGVLLPKNNNFKPDYCIANILQGSCQKYVSKSLGNPKLMNNIMGGIEILIPNSIERQKHSDFIKLYNFILLKHESIIEILKNKKNYYLNKLFI